MQPGKTQSDKGASKLRAYVVAATLVVVAVAVGSVLRRLPHANLSLLFLFAVVVVAAVWGFWPSIFATVLSFLAINFFFTAPLYSFTVEEEGDLASIVFFLAMAALTANLAARVRNEMAESRSALGYVSTLLEFSGKMSSAVSVQSAFKALARTLSLPRGRPVAVRVSEKMDGPGLIAVSSDTARQLDTAEFKQFLHSDARSAVVKADVTFFRLDLSDDNLAVVAIGGGALGTEERKFADGLCEQASLAVERILLVESLKTAQLSAQTEQLRSALLASVSHDLRTPLASIIGSVSSVLEYREILKQEDRRDLMQTVLEEAQRLDRYIQNLLDVTRFGHDRIDLRREWSDLNDIVSAAFERLGPALKKFDVVVEIPSQVALVYVQGALIEQALVNILDNAIDFSEPGDRISVRARFENDATVIDVIDSGQGIPEEEREKVFDMFYMAKQPDDRQHGVGLGLTICRSIIEAHGGTISALPGEDSHGTCMRIRLPVKEIPISGNDV
jgi:two-component system sensor histidine kinase KdpD